MSKLTKNLDLGNGLLIRDVNIDTIQATENGARVVTKQGVDIQVLHKDAPEELPGIRINKLLKNITWGDFEDAAITGIQAKYTEA
jgi:hypothetical protein